MEPDSCRGLDHPKFKVNKKILERQTDLAAESENTPRGKCHWNQLRTDRTSPSSQRDNLTGKVGLRKKAPR